MDANININVTADNIEVKFNGDVSGVDIYSTSLGLHIRNVNKTVLITDRIILDLPFVTYPVSLTD